MNFANKISIFRILSVPFFVGSLIYYNSHREYLRFVALGIFLLAVVSDAIDGYIARKEKQQTKAGAVLDPLGDKLLLVSAFICLSFDKFYLNFPLWVILIVISRDIIILLGAIVVFIVKHDIEVVPTLWGKWTTIFQMVAIIGVLVQWPFVFVAWWIAVIFTVISGMDYIKRGFKLLYVVDNNRNHR
jgi:CDP-diacylglycerol--glycerol-3-phosphate 3-phosphatidyltransferase